LPTITKITKQKKNKERYNIFLDEEYALSVDESLIIKYQLTKGFVIENDALNDLVYDDEVKKAFNRGLNFISYRMRSESELKNKLVEKEFSENVIDEAIKKLKYYGFINDETFTTSLIENHKTSSKKGPMAIRQELTKKGIDKNLQEEFLQVYDEEEQIGVASIVAEKLRNQHSTKTPLQVKQKIQETLTRKGFSFSITKQVIETMSFERDEDTWENMINEQGDKIWKKYSSKLSGYDLKNKVKQSLYQKGFSSDHINFFVEQKLTNDE
jgi:regulatory protein